MNSSDYVAIASTAIAFVVQYVCGIADRIWRLLPRQMPAPTCYSFSSHVGVSGDGAAADADPHLEPPGLVRRV